MLTRKVAVHAYSAEPTALINVVRSSGSMEVPGLPAHHDAPPDPGERAGHLLRQEGKIRIRVYWIVEFFGSGSVVTLRVARPRVYTWLGFVCLGLTLAVSGCRGSGILAH